MHDDANRVTDCGAPLNNIVLRPFSRTFVFVGGLHRSGTTLIARCLADHPDASGFHNTGAPEDEGQHLQSVYAPGEQFGGPGRFGFAPEMHMTEHSALVSDGNRQRLLFEWARHWQCDRRVLIEKSPPNLLKSRFLQALFPTAHFIMVLRHPIATSLATRKCSGARMSSLIEHWLRCNETMLEDIGHLRYVTLVRYEDFMENPDRELAHLQGFVGIEPRPCTAVARQGLNRKYFNEWRRREWSPFHRILVRRFEHRAAKFGYSLRAPETAAGTYEARL